MATKQHRIVVFFNKAEGQYFLSILHEQPGLPGFVPTSFSVPHYHTTEGLIETGEDIVKAYYVNPVARRVSNHIDVCEPEQLAGFTNDEKAAVTTMLVGHAVTDGDLNYESLERVTTFVNELTQLMDAISNFKQ